MTKNRDVIINNHARIENRMSAIDCLKLTSEERGKKVLELTHKAEQALNECRIMMESYIGTGIEMKEVYIDESDIGGYKGYSLEPVHDMPYFDFMGSIVENIGRLSDELKRQYDFLDKIEEIEDNIAWMDDLDEARDAYYEAKKQWKL